MKQSREERCTYIIELLEKEYPIAPCSLIYTSPFQLLIATILAARTRDDCVNAIAPQLFNLYPDAKAMAKASPDHLFKIIKDVTYPDAKTDYLIKTSSLIDEKYNGIVPSDFMTLQSFPGVGRKTANMICVEAFGIPAFPVDTHIQRISYRLGLTNSNDVLHTEKLLCQFIPKEAWKDTYRRMILHGKNCCSVIQPKCEKCCIRQYCETLNPSQKEQQYFLNF